MNKNPKLYNAVKARDLGLSQDLQVFISDQMQDDDKDYISRQWIADTLTMLQDMDANDEEGMGESKPITDELAELARLLIEKRILIVLL
jgi:hypothetical protein